MFFRSTEPPYHQVGQSRPDGFPEVIVRGEEILERAREISERVQKAVSQSAAEPSGSRQANS